MPLSHILEIHILEMRILEFHILAAIITIYIIYLKSYLFYCDIERVIYLELCSLTFLWTIIFRNNQATPRLEPVFNSML